MTALLDIREVYRRFAPDVSLGDRIAARLGAAVETRAVRAVDGVTLSIEKGETLGLVGESGCGKSTLGRIAAGILPPTSGTITLDGEPVYHRGRKLTTRVQSIFQDPFASLDPRMRVGDTIAEGPLAHGLIRRSEARAFVARWLDRVGLDGTYANRLPHQFSGGQRQRIAIARALAMNPDLVICDEPVASLDVSIQAQIINLFLRLRRELGVTMLFISHDLSVVRHIADRIAVMYLGRIVEEGPTARVYTDPRHPYTQALLASVPQLTLIDDAAISFETIMGEIPSPLSPPPGCHFHPRCPIAVDRCRAEVPQLAAMGGGQRAACFLAGAPRPQGDGDT